MKLDAKPDRLISTPEALTDGELDLQLIPAKSRETEDALFIQDRKHGLLFVGDAFMPYVGAPFVAEGSPEGYLGAIAQVLELHPRRLIHGHPPLTALFTIEAMPGLRDALGELFQSALSAARNARPLADVLQDNLLPAALRSAPAAVQPYLLLRDTFVQRLYAEHAGYWQANGDGMDHFTRAQWAAALDALGVSNDTAFARAAIDLEARGDATLALHLVDLGLARYPASQPLQKAREQTLTRLRQSTLKRTPSASSSTPSSRDKVSSRCYSPLLPSPRSRNSAGGVFEYHFGLGVRGTESTIGKRASPRTQPDAEIQAHRCQFELRAKDAH